MENALDLLSYVVRFWIAAMMALAALLVAGCANLVPLEQLDQFFLWSFIVSAVVVFVVPGLLKISVRGFLNFKTKQILKNISNASCRDLLLLLFWYDFKCSKVQIADLKSKVQSFRENHKTLKAFIQKNKLGHYSNDVCEIYNKYIINLRFLVEGLVNKPARYENGMTNDEFFIANEELNSKTVTLLYKLDQSLRLSEQEIQSMQPISRPEKTSNIDTLIDSLTELNDATIERIKSNESLANEARDALDSGLSTLVKKYD